MLDVNNFSAIKVSVASSEEILSWSKGEVRKPETINYRTLKPERDGLFCEKIFGPTRDWECHCGKYKRIRFKGIVCDRCGVEVTRAKVRRERMGHIELATPVSHIWYFKGTPSRIGAMLELTQKALEKVLYFASYIVLETGDTPLIKKQLLTESEYRENREKYGNEFRAAMGAEAVYELLCEINLEELSSELRKAFDESSGQKKLKIIRRMEVVEAFRKSGNRPEWMIMKIVPVIPPDLRPMVQLDGGRFATSDLNDLYRRVINRNNRLKRLLDLGAPDIIVRNEKRMLQEAVDALIDNGRRGRPVTGPANRPLKSLSDMLKGKQGRFRQNLLGKRVDYSGRSVIVIGPELKLNQCGLPKEMALELFKPFVMKKLTEMGVANNIKSAKRMVERVHPVVWDVLEEVIKGHPVLLNRAPTLHRLGIQAFEPVLSEGRAIKIHPLVCTAYNADFDGDQMAVHVPLSPEAQAEARILMLAANNILSMKDGRPVTVPTQDMVLGAYYLTFARDQEDGNMRFFIDENEAMNAYYLDYIGLQEPMTVKIPGYGRVVTTVGRLIFNMSLAKELRTFKQKDGIWHLGILMDKKALGKLAMQCYRLFGAAKTADTLDKIKKLGFHYAMKAGITIGLLDIVIPEKKKDILASADEKVEQIDRQYRRGLITKDNRYERVVSIWKETTNEVTNAMISNLDKLNPVYMMANSGARGSTEQTRQLAGMRGLMSDPSGRIIDMPIKANFREGLSVLDYFISTHGARKGLADTALRTADSGYLTRRLVDVSQDLIVREDDCDIKTVNVPEELRRLGKPDIENEKQWQRKLSGRAITQSILKTGTDEVLLEKDTVLEAEHYALLCANNIEEVYVWSLSSTQTAQSGEYEERFTLSVPFEKRIQILRSRMIRELAGKDVIKDVVDEDGNCLLSQANVLTMEKIDEILSKKVREVVVRKNTIRGIALEPVCETKKRYQKKKENLDELLIDTVGLVLAEHIYHPVTGELVLPRGIKLSKQMVENLIQVLKTGSEGERVVFVYQRVIEQLRERIVGRYAAEKIVDPDTGEILVNVNEMILEDVAERIVEFRGRVFVRSVMTCKSQFGICSKCYGRNLGTDQLVEVGEAVGIIAAQSIGEPGTQLTMRTFHTGGVAGDDITQGLPRVEELFEGRKPKRPAVLVEIDGEVTVSERDGMRHVIVTPERGLERVYSIPYNAKLCVATGDYVQSGDRLTEGAINPHDILRIRGLQATQRYLVQEVQNVYRDQGVEINDKHIEIIVRQMLHKVKIEDPGDTELLPGSYVDINLFEEANADVIEAHGEPAVARPALLGITKASLSTDSFLSAASFQETARVLTEAATKGKEDPLIGLKENVIIGKLVPSGTGMKRYRDIEVVKQTKPIH